MKLIIGKIIWGGIIAGIDLMVKPTLSLLQVVGVCIVFDLVTGITKAVLNKKQRTSEGYRKTVIKILQYSGPILVLYGAGLKIPEYKDQLHIFCGWVMMFIIYIEVTSIFENLYEIDKRSPISRYGYKNILKILKFGLTHNELAEAAKREKQSEKEKSDPPANE